MLKLFLLLLKVKNNSAGMRLIAREISHVRIHVEHVISLLKSKYTILKGVILISLLKNKSIDICAINSILTVCSALCNMCESVVPFN